MFILLDLPGAYAGKYAPNWRSFRGRYSLLTFTTPEDLAERLRAFAREGISHVQFWMEPATMASIDLLAPTLKLLDRGMLHTLASATTRDVPGGRGGQLGW